VKDGIEKRGGTWTYVVRVRDPQTGHMKDAWVGGFATEHEAKVARNAARTAADQGTAVAATRITVREYLEEWLEASAARVRPTTLVSYTLHVRRYIVPAIGAGRLQQLTPAMIDKMNAALLKSGRMPRRKLAEGEKPPPPQGLSPATVRRCGATLHKALRDAVRKKLIPYNPADAVDLPRVKAGAADAPDDLRVWTHFQLDRFLAHVAGERLFPMWRLAAWTGMRRGEIAGLTWRDVDTDTGTLTVRRARVNVTSADVRESKPKTARGRRRVELDEETRVALAAWRERQEAERKAWQDAWSGDDLVFTLQDGSALRPDYLSRTFQARAARAGLPVIRFHDLRHTHASLLLAAGVPVKVVSERLGHSTVAFTMDVYQHVLPGQQREAVQALADAVPGGSRRLRIVGA
jgi:integrase